MQFIILSVNVAFWTLLGTKQVDRDALTSK